MIDKNKIIKNVYYMLAYAFRAITQDSFQNVNVEEFDEIHDLFAAILATGVGIQLKRGLHREYIDSKDDIQSVRGKINLEGTIKNQLSRKKRINCEFDELSENNLFNKILKTTMMLLISYSDVKEEYKDDLKKILLYFSNIDTVNPTNINWSVLRFQRSNQSYRVLISICQLMIEGMLMTTDSGDYKLASFVDEQKMCRLYEKFILEYYIRHFPMLNAFPFIIDWEVDDDYRVMLPKMETDIHLQKGNDVLIIDAKYYSHTTQKQFDKNSIHSNNLYQIFTYVKNRDYKFGDVEHKVSGMLLYAKTEDEIQPDNTYKMHGNKIYVKTLDLNKDFKDIALQLDIIVKEYFDVSKVD